MSLHGVSHIGLSTLDLAATRAFYEDVLGFPLVRADLVEIGDTGRMKHFFFDAGNGQLIGFMSGEATALVDFRHILTRRLTITGSTLRPRTVEEKGQIASALRTEIWPLLDRGAVKPVIHRIFPLAKAAEAHRLMESSEHVGKIVLGR